MSKPTKHNWRSILKDVIYNHEADTIEFGIKDIESLDALINSLDKEVRATSNQNERFANRIKDLEKQLLVATLTKSTQKVSDFDTYA